MNYSDHYELYDICNKVHKVQANNKVQKLRTSQLRNLTEK